jgi:hypothetical protein
MYRSHYLYRDVLGFSSEGEIESRMNNRLVEFIGVEFNESRVGKDNSSLRVDPMVKVREPESGEEFFAYPEELEGFDFSPRDWAEAAWNDTDLLDAKFPNREYRPVYCFKNKRHIPLLAKYHMEPAGFIRVILEPDESRDITLNEVPLVEVVLFNGEDERTCIVYPDELEGFALSPKDHEVLSNNISGTYGEPDFSTAKAAKAVARQWIMEELLPSVEANIDTAYRSGAFDSDDYCHPFIRAVVAITAESRQHPMLPQHKKTKKRLENWIG